MNSNELHTFLTVADLASISAAADLLHLSQPAVTKRIQNLEARLATPLFDRVGKRLLLTPAGRSLQPRAQQILSAWADTQRDLQNLSTAVSGTLHLATSHHIGLHRLAPVLRRYRERYPQVQMNIAFEDSEVAHELVRQGEIELAVATLDPAGEGNLTTRVIWDDPLVFVDPELSPDKAPVTLEFLARRPCVMPGTNTYTGRIVLERFEQAGIELRPVMSTNYLETIGMLVTVGLGWSVIPASMLNRLSPLHVEGAPMSRSLGCITNPERAMSNAARAFIEVLNGFSDSP